MKRTANTSEREEAEKHRQIDLEQKKLRKQKEMETLRKKEEAKNKFEEKIFKKKGKRGLWNKYQYHVVFSILLFLFLFALFGRKTGESRSLSEISVNDEIFISSVNNEDRPYKLDTIEFFDGWTLQDAKNILKNGVTKKKSMPQCQPNNALPSERFDFREKHPSCVVEVANQGNCSSSFAFATTGMFSDRSCVSDGEVRTFTASPQHPLACDRVASRGCLGGYLTGSLDLGRIAGYVDTDCVKYNIEKANDCQESIVKKCKRHFVGDYCALQTVNSIKNSISTDGPVVAMVQVTKEFLAYRSGIYDETFSQYKLEGSQAVKVIGWDYNQEGEEYWIIENSWGSSWGQNGYGFVKIGVLDSMLDKFALGCTVKDGDGNKTPKEE